MPDLARACTRASGALLPAMLASAAAAAGPVPKMLQRLDVVSSPVGRDLNMYTRPSTRRADVLGCGFAVHPCSHAVYVCMHGPASITTLFGTRWLKAPALLVCWLHSASFMASVLV